MAFTEVEVCNLALTELGEDAITSLDDDSDRARVCKKFYGPSRNATLRAHPWNFALKRAQLAQLATAPAWGFSYAYQLPSDCLRVLRFDVDGAVWRIEARTLVTNESEAKVLYIAETIDPNLFDATFADTLAAHLAWRLAYTVTGKRNLGAQMWELYKQRLAAARTADGMEGVPEQFESDDLIRVRY